MGNRRGGGLICKWSLNNQQGMTYIEVLAAMMVILLGIAGISRQYVVAIKVNQSAKQVEETAASAQHLVREIKARFMQDEKSIKNQLQVGTGQSFPLEELIKEYPLYHTDLYSYEVGLWRLQEMDLSTGFFPLSQEVISLGTLFYTDLEAHEEWLQAVKEKGEQLVQFKVTKEMSKIFIDEELRYLPSVSTADKKNQVLDWHKLALDSEGELTLLEQGTQNRVKIEIEKVLDSAERHIGFVITSHDTGAIVTASNRYRHVIELNLMGAGRQGNEEKLWVKWRNQTDYDQVIQLIDHKEIEEKALREEPQMILESLAEGKSSLMRTKQSVTEENYWVIVIVRAKQPSLGLDNQMIRCEVDLYTTC